MKQKMTTCILQTYIQHSTRQAAKELWNLSGSSTTGIWIAGKYFLFFFYFLFLFLLSEYIEWPLMRRISVKILVFDIWDALKPMYASKLSNVAGYLTVFHYHEATPVNIHR